jgi:hypothetical protein
VSQHGTLAAGSRASERHSLPEEKRAERAKKEQFSLFIPWATARRSHRGIRPMVYILKGKVSLLRLMVIIWTASSDAARQACGKAAAAREILKL